MNLRSYILNPKSIFHILYSIFLVIVLFILIVPTAHAADYYISPNGNDANSGTSQSSPIKTFSKAWQKLYPSDTLLLMDGTYTPSTTGMINPNVRNGTSNTAINVNDYTTYPLDHPDRIKNYIKIKSLNDGKAIIDGQNAAKPVVLGHWEQGGIGNYYILEGLVAKNSSENVFFIMSHNVIVRRCSGFNSDTHDNTGVFEIWSGGSSADPSNILLEDNFASGLGRKMFMAYSSYVNIIFRRNVGYIREIPQVDQSCQNDWPNGDNIEIYNWNQQDLNNNSIVENNIALGGGPTYGFSLTPNPARTIGNKYLGNISINSGMNLDGTYRVWNCSDMAPACVNHGTKCAANGSTDWLYHRTGFTFGIYANPYFKNNTFQDLFAWGNASFGLTAGGNWCDGSEPAGTYPCARCNTVENNPNENCSPSQLTSSDRSSGNLLNRVTLVNNSIASASPYNHSGIEAPSEVLDTFRTYGTLGDMYIEGDSQHADKSKGARLRFRYVNGSLTTQELWPWPMEERIKTELAREIGIQNYSVTNKIVPLINQYTAIPVNLNITPSPTTILSPSPTGNQKAGDANSDGKVDGIDYAIWLIHFGQNTTNGYRDGDFNDSGRVDGIDYAIWLVNFGR